MTDDNCLFCKIIRNEIPCSRVYETKDVLAFRDIAPQAPTHILVVPKTHIPSLAEVDGGNVDAASKCLTAIAEIAAQQELDSGFRVIANSGEDAGQTVPHLHFHILAGCPLKEKLV